MTERDVARLCRDAWASPYRGAYVDRAALRGADPRERLRLLAAARIVSLPLRAVVSHRTAAVVHDLPVLGRLPRTP